MDGQSKTLNPVYKCQYCEKEFRRESTLAAHLCENKRRYQQKNERGVQLGLQAYLRFYELTQGSAQFKTYDDFAGSPYYGAFVKFGRYCVNIKCVNFVAFTDWLLKNNKKLDHWARDSLYTEWLLSYIKKESVQDALERSLLTMQEWADENTSQFNHYFLYANANKVCYHISTGRVSPWVIYNSGTGVAWLEKLNEEQIGMIIEWIDPDYWARKFQDYLADTEWIKTVLQDSKL